MITIEQVSNGFIIEDSDCEEAGKIVIEDTGIPDSLEHTKNVLWVLADILGLDVGNKHTAFRLFVETLPNEDDTRKYMETIKDTFLWEGCDIRWPDIEENML